MATYVDEVLLVKIYVIYKKIRYQIDKHNKTFSGSNNKIEKLEFVLSCFQNYV